MGRTIGVTGGSRGIGYALVAEFLRLGCNVVFTGTSQTSVDHAKQQLDDVYPADASVGIVADVRQVDAGECLIQQCIQSYGSMDIMINNAGVDQMKAEFVDLPASDIDRVIDINLKGTMQGVLAALRYYREQGHGAVYTMEGFGSDDRMTDRMVVYGTSKRAIRYFTRALAKEVKDEAILVGALSPGMVVTDFLMNSIATMDADHALAARKIFNILADRPEDVAAFLAQQVLHNTRNNAKIYWLTTSKIIFRFMTSAFRKRNLFETDGRD